MKQTIIIIIERVNVSKVLCRHIIGQKHTPTHRTIVGITLMIIGVTVNHFGARYDVVIVQYLTDIFRDCTGAIGAIPILQSFTKQKI